MKKFKYEAEISSLMTQIVDSSYQHSSTLVYSYLSSRIESDYEMAVDEAKTTKDIVRMDANRNTGVFASGNHQKIIESIDQMIYEAGLNLIK